MANTAYQSTHTGAQIDAAIDAVANKQEKVTAITDLGGVSLGDGVVFNVSGDIKSIGLPHLKKMLTSEYDYNNKFENATFNQNTPTDGRSYGPKYADRNYEGKTLRGVRVNVDLKGYGKVVVVHGITTSSTVTTSDYDVYSIYSEQTGIQDIFLENDVVLSTGDIVLVGSDASKTLNVDRMTFSYAMSNATGCTIGFCSFSNSNSFNPIASTVGFIGVDLIIKEADSFVTVYSGSSAPSSSTGSNGDIYIQTS